MEAQYVEAFSAKDDRRLYSKAIKRGDRRDLLETYSNSCADQESTTSSTVTPVSDQEPPREWNGA